MDWTINTSTSVAHNWNEDHVGAVDGPIGSLGSHMCVACVIIYRPLFFFPRLADLRANNFVTRFKLSKFLIQKLFVCSGRWPLSAWPGSDETSRTFIMAVKRDIRWEIISTESKWKMIDVLIVLRWRQLNRSQNEVIGVNYGVSATHWDWTEVKVQRSDWFGLFDP